MVYPPVCLPVPCRRPTLLPALSAASQVGAAAAFLCSPLASAITGATVYVDNGLNTMGLATDSKTLTERE